MFVLPPAVVTIPIVHGKPINIWGGILLGILIVFQLLTGLRVIKVPNRSTAGMASPSSPSRRPTR